MCVCVCVCACVCVCVNIHIIYFISTNYKLSLIYPLVFINVSFLSISV